MSQTCTRHAILDYGRTVSLLLCLVTLGLLPRQSLADQLESNIDALAEQIVEGLHYFEDEPFKKLSADTQGLLKEIARDKIRIGLYKMLVDQLKREPSLTDEQVQWLVEIDDHFVRAEQSFDAARAMVMLADDNMAVSVDHKAAFTEASRNLSEAYRTFEKSKRDLLTLRARVEIQTKRD